MTIVIASITLVIAAVAVYTDVRWGKIFNAVTVPAILVGLILNTVDSGLAGLGMSLQGVGVGLGLFIVSGFLGRILGGGDIKLLVALGALRGPVFLLWTIVGAAGAGAVLAIVIALYNRILIAKLKSLVTTCYMRVAHRVPMDMEQDAASPRLPYSIAIGVCVVMAMAVARL